MLRKKLSAVFFVLTVLWQQLLAFVLMPWPVKASTDLLFDPQLEWNQANSEVTLRLSDTLLSTAKSVTYTLQYDHLAQESEAEITVTEQMKGEIEVGETTETTLYLGSCSSEACTAHQDISQGTLTLSAVSTDGSTKQNEYRLWWVNEVIWLESAGRYQLATVSLNTTYQLPGQSVAITFDTLPEHPGTLSIEPMVLDQDTQESTGALSPLAYEITSSMPNGSFSYHLSLPVTTELDDEQPVAIKFAESVTELRDPTQAGMILAELDQDQTTATISDVDHFTVFVVVDPTQGQTSGGAGLAWNNPNRVIANDNSAASVTFPFLAFGAQSSEALLADNYGLAVPADAVVEGIQVRVRRRTTFDLPIDARDSTVRLMKAGAAVGSNLAQAGSYPSNYSYATYGGANDLWGTTWTPAEVNDPAFGVHFVAQRNAHILPQTVQVDHIEVTVFYNTPPTVTVSAPNGGEVWAGGSTQTITWTANDVDGDAVTVDLAYTTDGVTFTPIATGLANSGAYNWVVPVIDSTTVLVRATVRDPQAATTEDSSDAVFTIDSTAPVAPLFWVEEDSAAAQLEWLSVSDAVFYNIFQDGVGIASLAAPTTSITIPGLTTAQTYVYEVRAVDLAGNESVPQTAKAVQPFDVVIDDDAYSSDFAATGTVAHTGVWGAYSSHDGGYAADVLQNAVGGDTWSIVGTANDQTYTWTTNSNLNGWYEMYVQYICDPARGTAHYVVRSGANVVTAAPIALNQATTDGVSAACAAQSTVSEVGAVWVSLGQFPIVDAPAQIELVAEAGQAYLLADAVAMRFVEPVNTVQGRVFRDVNADGVFNPTERTVPGRPNLLNNWLVQLFDASWNQIDQMNSGDDATFAGAVAKGQYRFVGLRAGTYYVCQEEVSGWMQTAPVVSSSTVVTDPNQPGWNCYQLALSGGQTATGVRFGVFELGRIVGTVFNDHDANATLDSGEVGLYNWKVFVDANLNRVHDSGELQTWSDGNGEYAFTDLQPGDYQICSNVHTGWARTAPTTPTRCYTIAITTSGQVAEHTDFGNVAVPGNNGPFTAPTGGTTPAEASSCAAATPAAAPANLRIAATGWQSVTLAWDAVAPSTHYAVAFTRLSDGASYGSANIGQVTSYTINGLSGNDAYRFEVFAVNGCAPGARAVVQSGMIVGPVLNTRPVGEDGQVLGSDQDGSHLLEQGDQAVLGRQSGSDQSSCSSHPWWWISLVILAVAFVVSTLIFRSSLRRVGMALGLMVAIVLLHRWVCQPWPWVMGTVLATICGEIVVTLVNHRPKNGKPKQGAPVKMAKIDKKVVQPKAKTVLPVVKPVVPAPVVKNEAALPPRRRRRRRQVVRFFV